mmetsp:Transcript_31274/g.71407  ORF Transcript_31274/g.71407 Transcript_31274/m.71407 type:complete len:235 (+) Transcript_31274:85-789(+)
MARAACECSRPGCKYPTADGLPGFCSPMCRSAWEMTEQRPQQPLWPQQPPQFALQEPEYPPGPPLYPPNFVQPPPPTAPVQCGPTCQRPGCPHPTFDGKPGGYCSKRCKNAQPQAPPAPPPQAPGGVVTCMRPGCQYPSFDGQPGHFCSKTCKQAATQSVQPQAKAPQAPPAGAVCQRPGCVQPTYNGQPGFCSKTCKAAAQPAAPQGGCPVCGKKSSGQSRFCSMECMEKNGP